MSENDSKKKPGSNLVENAAVAMHRASRAVHDVIYEGALAQEKELLAARIAKGPWRPPTEEEFNHSWFKPLDVLDVSDDRLADDAEKWEIIEQLRAGQIIAVARTAQPRGDIAGVQPLVPVSAGAWRRMIDTDEHYFWKTGHLVVEAPDTTATGYGRTGAKERYFNIRFDPDSFSGKPPPSLPQEERTEPQHPAKPSPKPTGGRPRNAFWDPLWIEMIRRIRAGTLNPKSSTELEGTMEDWLDDEGFAHGEGTLHRTAINLFKYLQEK